MYHVKTTLFNKGESTVLDVLLHAWVMLLDICSPWTQQWQEVPFFLEPLITRPF